MYLFISILYLIVCYHSLLSSIFLSQFILLILKQKSNCKWMIKFSNHIVSSPIFPERSYKYWLIIYYLIKYLYNFSICIKYFKHRLSNFHYFEGTIIWGNHSILKHNQRIHKGERIDSNVCVILLCGVTQWRKPKYSCQSIVS